MFVCTAAASSGVPSLNRRPGRSLKVIDLPSAEYFQLSASPPIALPLLSSAVIALYARLSTCTSQPALDVTGSHDVGSSHSHFNVPPLPLLLPPPAVWVVTLPALHAAATAANAARTAIDAARRIFVRLSVAPLMSITLT
jgi:hypothetical protein